MPKSQHCIYNLNFKNLSVAYSLITRGISVLFICWIFFPIYCFLIGNFKRIHLDNFRENLLI